MFEFLISSCLIKFDRELNYFRSSFSLTDYFITKEKIALLDMYT